MAASAPILLKSSCFPMPSTGVVGSGFSRRRRFGSFSASRQYDVRWSSRMQACGQLECKLLVSGCARRWFRSYSQIEPPSERISVSGGL